MGENSSIIITAMIAVIMIVLGAVFIIMCSDDFNKAPENVFSKPAVSLSDVNLNSYGNFHTYVTLDTFIRKGSESHTRMVGKVSSTYHTYYYIYVGSDKTGSAVLRFENNEQKLNKTLHISGNFYGDIIRVNKIAEE